MNQFETFLQLHHAATPLVIANCWDAGSARLLQDNGFYAIATSSAAVANSMGYEDGEGLPFHLLLETAARIKNHISVPLSVDMEMGFGNSDGEIVQNIEKLYDIGASGINIEDSAGGKLLPVDLFSNRLSAITESLSKKNIKIFINVRTDAFLLKTPDALTETVNRAHAYQNTGVHGIFAPFVTDEAAIKTIVAATTLPLNLLSVPDLPDFIKLAALGVARISMGSSLYRSVNKEMVNKLQLIQQQQSFECLFS